MRTTDGRTLAKVAEPLRDDEVHAWWLPWCRGHGRAPLRAVLAGYLGTTPGALALVEGEHGRPALAAPHAALAFNWSHSGGHAVVAVARGIVPGVDLERLRPRPRALEIARRYFCPAEADALAALPGPQRDEAFLGLWTAKEAVLKALGRGLAFGLDRLQLAVPPAPARLLWLDGEDAAAWQLHRYVPDPAYVATLAWRGPPRRIVFRALAADG
jgi:4'-phosphopantetheinyl transferase